MASWVNVLDETLMTSLPRRGKPFAYLLNSPVPPGVPNGRTALTANLLQNDCLVDQHPSLESSSRDNSSSVEHEKGGQYKKRNDKVFFFACKQVMDVKFSIATASTRPRSADTTRKLFLVERHNPIKVVIIPQEGLA